MKFWTNPGWKLCLRVRMLLFGQSFINVPYASRKDLEPLFFGTSSNARPPTNKLESHLANVLFWEGKEAHPDGARTLLYYPTPPHFQGENVRFKYFTSRQHNKEFSPALSSKLSNSFTKCRQLSSVKKISKTITIIVLIMASPNSLFLLKPSTPTTTSTLAKM